MSVEMKVPDIGESVTEVYIGEWRKSEGDRVKRDEDLVELESDKATFDAPAPSTGVLERILKRSGETAEVGEVIAYIDESASPDEPDADAATKRGTEDKVVAADEGEPRLMPAARRLLAQHGVDPADVKATGPGGRLLKEDVQRHIDEGGAGAATRKASVREPDPGGQTERVPMSAIRRRIAERLVEAQNSAALLTTFNEIDMSAVSELRRRHQEAFRDKYKIKLGFMSFFVKAAIDALRQFPQLNAMIDESEIVYHNYFDVGIAIGTEKGLVVPVLRNAERMSFSEIETAIDDFARRAQTGALSIEELQGGTFTISNGGIYGSLLSTPIVNPPQSGVLGMHAIQERPVAREGNVVVRPMMYVALSYDHRIVDGREAVTFLRRIREAIEEPARMLIEV
jgi:2-oxoglutarate dehydrogenase E2 component (dihydrolipoamide succinyltransferase)